MVGELKSWQGSGVGSLLALQYSVSLNIVIFPKIHLSSQKNHPGWLSKPVSFRNQSSLTPRPPPPPFFNSPAGPDANWHACLLPWGRGTSELWGKAEPEPRPLLPAQNSFPPCAAPPNTGGRERGGPENRLSLAWPFPGASAHPKLSLTCVCSVVSDSATFWTVARQLPLSMRLSKQEYWSGLPFPPPGDLPDPEIEPMSPALPASLADSTNEPLGKPLSSPCSFSKCRLFLARDSLDTPSRC